jgi:DHA1 family bicyclomycin/chloramphenicol resistance-like MFS transporter
VAAYSLGLVASSIYTPSIPDMARDLVVPVGHVQLSFTVYLLAFAPAMLIIGPLSDRYGRRRILIAGTLLCFAASVVCATAPTIGVLLIGRALQAVGACAGLVISRAVVRDIFDRDRTARAMSTLASAATLMPILSPIVGGYLHVWLGWRANFALLVAFTAILLAVSMAWLPETNHNLQNQVGLLRGVLTGIAVLLRHRRFLGYAVIVGGGGGAFYGFGTAGPVLLIDRYGVPPEHYGFYSIAATIGFVIGSFLSSRIVMRTGIERLIWIGGIVVAVAGIVTALISGLAQAWALIPPLALLGLGAGLSMPNAMTGSVNLQPHLAGTASGLTGAVQMVGASAATMAMAATDIQTAIPIAVVFIIAAVLTFAGIALAGGTRAA